MSFITRLLSAVRQVLGLFLPVFAKARDFGGKWGNLRWFIHVVVVLLVLIALGLIGRRFREELPLYLAPDWFVSRFGAAGWLVFIGLLVYLMGWLAWWIWKLLGLEEDVSSFPDIDRDWQEAMRGLAQAQMPITEFPLFLVLGQPDESESALFEASQIPMRVQGVPARADASVRVYAFRHNEFNSIFITCRGASVIGRQAAILAGKARSGLEGQNAVKMDETLGTGKIFESIGAGFGSPEDITRFAQSLAEIRRQGRTPEQMTEEERRRFRSISRQSEPPLVQNAALVEDLSARLRHLCRLIVRDRQSLVPVNGIVVLLPLAASDSKQDAEQTAATCQRDLMAIRQVMQLQCPCFALVCDLERMTGFRELLERIPPGWRRQRLGKGFPLVPDLRSGQKPATREEMVTSIVSWFCRGLFPSWINRRFVIETPKQPDMNQAVSVNIKLYQLMREMHEREPRLSHLVARGLTLENDEPVWLGGFYVAGTGANANTEQAFVSGVFHKVIEFHERISWTDEALSREAAYQSWRRKGYWATVGLAVAVAALVVVAILWRNSGTG